MGSDGADSVGSAGVSSDAGIDAIPVPAYLLVSTLAVRCTTGNHRLFRELAINICIPDISGNAHANHGPLGQGVLHGAVCVGAAGRELRAGVPAVLLETRLPTRAVSVHPALRLRLRDGEAASVVGVSLVVGDALAASPVTPHYAVGINCTVTWIYAFLIPACEHLRTLVIHNTLWVVALYVGVTTPSVGAKTASPVVSSLAAGSYAALGEAAGVHTGSVYALVGEGALQVAVAAREDTCCVGVALQRGRADAGGPMVVDPADGLDSTLLPLGNTRVSALLPDTC